jgi:hypothetical protein
MMSGVLDGSGSISGNDRWRGHAPGRPHSLKAMSAQTGEPPAGDVRQVRVAEPVLQRLEGLSRGDAAAVARAILNVPSASAEPADFEVPGDPPGTEYWAVDPGPRDAPVVIYRKAFFGEGGRWLVAALISRDAYGQYRTGMTADPLVRDIARIVAAGTS